MGCPASIESADLNTGSRRGIMGVLTVVGIAVMCFFLYQIKEILESLDGRLSRIEDQLAD